jgi:hypothetical protein
MTQDEARDAACSSQLVDARLAAALREDPRTRRLAVDAIAALVLLIQLLRREGWSAADAGSRRQDELIQRHVRHHTHRHHHADTQNQQHPHPG